MKIQGFAWIVVAGGIMACGGGDPADFAGNYTVNITNRDNGCGFDNWMEGETATNIAVTITQDGDNLAATVEGAVGAYLSLVLGDNVFSGQADGDAFELTLFGTRSATEGNCTYTVNAVLDGALDGDVLEGQIRYQAATNGNPDCATIDGCESVQDFNGTRPPS